jgi:sugar phosphate isomerase/epimerase
MINGLGISTSWNCRRHSSGKAIIDEIRSTGFETVELNFALTEDTVAGILDEKEAGRITVSSLHNMCPLPAGVPAAKASPDYYSLASADEAERAMAVKAARTTLECAARFGAAAVVLHAGRVPVKDRTRELAGALGDPERSGAIRDEMARERSGPAREALRNVIRSLDELVRAARPLGVAIGVENRYYYSEIPLFEEFEELFSRYGDKELCYWHDTGHAEVFDRLGIGGHAGLLKRFGGRLIGMHLHDIIGPVTDHRPPGDGTFDFNIVKPYIKPATILVMEVHEPAAEADIRRGAGRLTEILR